MAKSPGHTFGQNIGNILEYIVLYQILKPKLEEFTEKNKFFLDWQNKRPVRKGKKVTWKDRYGNSHDLDFVIEEGGDPNKIGTPVAFIEAAWRRYTKHSKNKAQEIQGAILPIVELHNLSAPFHGAVLAGDFSKPALEQLRNNKFSVLYIPYANVVKAFKALDFDVAFDENTPHDIFSAANEKIKSLNEDQLTVLRDELIKLSKGEIDKFMKSLRDSLERRVIQIVLIPMFGTESKFTSVDDAIKSMATLDFTQPTGTFKKIEVIVDYNNGDSIRASFAEMTGAAIFLNGLVR